MKRYFSSAISHMAGHVENEQVLVGSDLKRMCSIGERVDVHRRPHIVPLPGLLPCDNGSLLHIEVSKLCYQAGRVADVTKARASVDFPTPPF